MTKLIDFITQNEFISIRSLMAFFILFLPLMSDAKDERIVWEYRLDYVALEVNSKNIENEHPISFSPQFIYQVLASIRLKDTDNSWINLDFLDFSADEHNKPDEYKLFNQSELKRLSPPIAKALSQANRDEDVIFSITSSHTKAFGKGSLSTSGRMFVSDSKFNLIIGELRVDMAQKYRQRGGYSDVSEKIDFNKLKKFRLKTGTRTSKSKMNYSFVTDEAHFLKSYKNKFREDWLLIDINRIQNQLAEQHKIAEQKDNIVQETRDIKQYKKQIDEEQEELKQKVERMERYLEAEDRKEKISERIPEQKVQERGSIEERLSQLKSLKDKEYITEEIYQQKMKEILKGL